MFFVGSHREYASSRAAGSASLGTHKKLAGLCTGAWERGCELSNPPLFRGIRGELAEAYYAFWTPLLPRLA